VSVSDPRRRFFAAFRLPNRRGSPPVQLSVNYQMSTRKGRLAPSGDARTQTEPGAIAGDELEKGAGRIDHRGSTRGAGHLLLVVLVFRSGGHFL
jgi:hypothetical protein